MLAEAAADGIVKLILKRRSRNKTAKIGLAGGRSMLFVVQALADRLRNTTFDLPSLSFHAICSSFDVKQPHTAPVSLLNYFYDAVPNVKLYGLFAPAVVGMNEYPSVMKSPGVKEALSAIKNVDIVITAVSSSIDRHSPLHDFAKMGGSPLETLENNGYRGDIAYAPFNTDGPIIGSDLGESRIVTLLEIEDLVAIAEKKRSDVVLIGGPCPQCYATRTHALEPILQNKSKLGVFSKLYLDVTTAKELVPDHG